MGLDSVELILAIEDKFGIYFDEKDSIWHKPDATFGDVVDEIRRLLTEKTNTVSGRDSAPADYCYEMALTELQNCLKEMFPLRNVSETERIARIVPYWKQSKHLAAIKKRFPEIECKERTGIIAGIIAFLWAGLLVFTTILSISLSKVLLQGSFVLKKLVYLPFLVLGILYGMVAIVFLSVYSISWIRKFIPVIGTVGDYARQIAAKRQQWNEWQEADGVKLEAELRKIFADTLGWHPEVIERKSLLGEDLDVG